MLKKKTLQNNVNYGFQAMMYQYTLTDINTFVCKVDSGRGCVCV